MKLHDMRVRASLCLLLLLLAVPPLAAEFLWTDDDGDGGTPGYQHTAVACSAWCMTPSFGGCVPVSTNPVHDGTNAINFVYYLGSTDPGEYVDLDVFLNSSGTPVDISEHNYLNFWVRGIVNSQKIRVGLQSGDGAAYTSALLLLEPYVEDDATGEGISETEWRETTVPLATLAAGGGGSFSLTAVDRVTFTLFGNDGDALNFRSLYVDYIFFNGPLAVRWPR